MNDKKLARELRFLASLIEQQQPAVAQTLQLAAERVETLNQERVNLDKRLHRQRQEIASLEALLKPTDTNLGGTSPTA